MKKCPTGKECVVIDDQGKCQCIKECPEVTDPRRRVCSNTNAT